jgi:hypothetical protein
MIGQQVVCICPIAERYCFMKVGEVYIVEDFQQSEALNNDLDLLSIKGISGRHWRKRFKPLEEMQDTNFHCIAKKTVE